MTGDEAHFAKWRGSDRHKAGDRSATASDGDVLARLDTGEDAREMGFCLLNIQHQTHLTKSSWSDSRASSSAWAR